jgi:hypothetical protein
MIRPTEVDSQHPAAKTVILIREVVSLHPVDSTRRSRR